MDSQTMAMPMTIDQPIALFMAPMKLFFIFKIFVKICA